VPIGDAVPVGAEPRTLLFTTISLNLSPHAFLGYLVVDFLAMSMCWLMSGRIAAVAEAPAPFSSPWCAIFVARCVITLKGSDTLATMAYISGSSGWAGFHLAPASVLCLAVLGIIYGIWVFGFAPAGSVGQQVEELPFRLLCHVANHMAGPGGAILLLLQPALRFLLVYAWYRASLLLPTTD
jgi:hypothetical protein